MQESGIKGDLFTNEVLQSTKRTPRVDSVALACLRLQTPEGWERILAPWINPKDLPMFIADINYARLNCGHGGIRSHELNRGAAAQYLMCLPHWRRAQAKAVKARSTKTEIDTFYET